MLRYAAFWCVIASLCACSSNDRRDGAITSFPADSLRTGDLLFRQGHSLSSYMVVVADGNGAYSHIGVAVEVDGQMLVAHAVPDEEEVERAKAEPLTHFFHKRRAASGAIGRFPLTEDQRLRLNAAIRRLVAAGALFDHDYQTEDSTTLYCSELVWRAYHSLGWDISRGCRAEIRTMFVSADVILPSHLLRHPELHVVTAF